MHSPIIYLIKNESTFTNSFEGQLPLKCLITNSTLLDYINESDYVETYYSDDSTEEINLLYKETFGKNGYFDLTQNEKGVYEISISHHNVINWDKRFLELIEKYSEIIKCNLSKNQFTRNDAFDTLQEYFEFQEMNGNDYGGVRFVIYKEIDGELEFDTVFNIRDLIYYAKSPFGIQSIGKEQYQICTNVLGDYHY